MLFFAIFLKKFIGHWFGLKYIQPPRHKTQSTPLCLVKEVNETLEILLTWAKHHQAYTTIFSTWLLEFTAFADNKFWYVQFYNYFSVIFKIVYT